MGYRGRLIHWFWVDVEQLDTAAMEAAGGYDADFRAPKLTFNDDGEVVQNRPVITRRLRAQVEQGVVEAQQQTRSGNDPDSRWVTVFFMPDLEREQLVDADGKPKLRVNDRLVAIYRRTGQLVRRLPPNVFATEVQPDGYGIGDAQNLVVVTWAKRAQGVRG